MKKILNNIKSILFNLIIFILVLLTLLVIYCFIQVNILDKEYINIFGYSIFQIETGSMSGTIEIDDIVLVKLGKSVSENDIVTYKKGNDFITHRIIKLEGNSFIAKGDNNNSQDEETSVDNIVGRVVLTLHNIKVWKAVFSDIKVIIPTIITFVLLILLVSYKEKIGEKDDA